MGRIKQPMADGTVRLLVCDCDQNHDFMAEAMIGYAVFFAEQHGLCPVCVARGLVRAALLAVHPKNYWRRKAKWQAEAAQAAMIEEMRAIVAEADARAAARSAGE